MVETKQVPGQDLQLLLFIIRKRLPRCYRSRVTIDTVSIKLSGEENFK